MNDEEAEEVQDELEEMLEKLIDEEQRTLERFVHEHPDEEEIKFEKIRKEGEPSSSSKDVPIVTQEVETLMMATQCR